MVNETEFDELFKLTGKTALVTGGAMGIGEGIARRLAQAGAAVMISDIDLNQAQETAASIRDAGGQVEAVRADSSSLDDIIRVTRAATEKFGGLHILVNNAGIFPMQAMLEITPENWRPAHSFTARKRLAE